MCQLQTKLTTKSYDVKPRQFSSTVLAGNELYVLGGSIKMNSTFGDPSNGSKFVDVFGIGVGRTGYPRKGPALIDPLKELGSCVIDDTLYAVSFQFLLKRVCKRCRGQLAIIHNVHLQIGGCTGDAATNSCTKLRFLDPNPRWVGFDDHLNVLRGSHCVAVLENTIFAVK